MTSFLIILALIISVLLVFVVLIQNPKGGGLASNFASSNQIMGVKKTTDFLEKATWTLAIALLVVCLAVNVFKPEAPANAADQTELQEIIDNTSAAPAAAPAPSASPAAVPAAADTTK
jgi:preprotein translocase subunit SecG